MGLSFLLVGPNPHNSTDGFIIRGIENLIYDAFPLRCLSLNYHLLDDHAPTTYRPEDEYDAIVICGTPWIWDQFYNSHKYNNLLNVFIAHPNAKRIFMGIGTCFNLDAMDSEICEEPYAQRAMRYMYDDALVFTRERLAKDKLDKAGVANTQLPCPAFYSVAPSPTPRHAHKSFCWADYTRTISGQYWLDHPELAAKLIERIIEEVDRTKPKIFKAHPEEADYLEHREGETIPGFNVACTMSILGNTSHLTSMRVHWAVPAMAMGIPTTIIPLDSRYLTTKVDISRLEEYKNVYIQRLRESMKYEHPPTITS